MMKLSGHSSVRADVVGFHPCAANEIMDINGTMWFLASPAQLVLTHTFPPPPGAEDRSGVTLLWEWVVFLLCHGVPQGSDLDDLTCQRFMI